MEEEIKSEFEKAGFSIAADDQILPTLLTYCINYKLSPSDLVSNWEIYYLNRQLNGLTIENAHLDGFLLHLQNEAKEKLDQEENNLHVYSSNDFDMLLNDRDDEQNQTFQGTPIGQRVNNNSDSTPITNGKLSSSREARASVNRITPFGQRTSKFTQQFTLNACNSDKEPSKQEGEKSEGDDEIIRRVQPRERCSLNVYKSQPETGCRFMYDRTEDRFNFLESRIKKCTDLFTASGFYGEPADATFASQNNVFAVGMVICDSEGHLNEKSVLLQGSVERSGGQRVRIDLQNLAQFSLFPGQVIGIEGRNPSGHHFVASKVVYSIPNFVDSALPPAKRKAVDSVDALSSPSSSRVLSAVIAAGPFTTSDNLLFEPLQDLLSYATRKQPQLLILMGPFIDSEHPDIKKGTVDRIFRDIFYFEVIRRIQDFTQYMGSDVRVILIPSIRDAHHDFVFPQPAFDVNLSEDDSHQITCLTNPSVFSSNEIMFSCCTVDVLKQLSGEEISRNPPNVQSDRIGRLATHLLKQHSYYPLYPPAVGVPLDFSLSPQALEILSAPDILLLPSDLAPFVKVLSFGEGNGETNERVMCVNPGRLAKGIGGGTFVEIHCKECVETTNASIIRI